MNKKNIVILTGAGISAESGIRTFRAADGLWEDHRVEDVATPEGFLRNQRLVHNFYNARRAKLFDPAVQPNQAHLAIARLQAALPGQVTLITQNVDNLHERGGSAEVWHMHGSLLEIACSFCHSVIDQTEDCSPEIPCPNCHVAGELRPNIVWFGEMPFYMDKIYKRLASCTHFAAIGTSGNVYPAAGFVQLAQTAGAKTYEINLEPGNSAGLFTYTQYGKASVEVPNWVDSMLN